MLDRPLAGRVALVTGATRGVGRAAALSLAAAGAHIIAVGRTQGALEALDDDIMALGRERATLVPMDISKGHGIDQLGLAIFQRHGRLDVLVHAAAMLAGLRPVAHIAPSRSGARFLNRERLVRAGPPSCACRIDPLLLNWCPCT